MFCSKWNIDPMQPLVNHVLDFLCELFDAGLGYSALNTARSAMSSFVFIDNVPVGSHSLVKRFMKGVFEQRPSLPRYQETWDVSLVLDLLRSWVPLNTISMKKLTLKLSMLIALTTAQRCQTLHLIKINDIVIQDTGSIIVYIGDKVKQSKPGLKQIKLWLPKCSEDKNNCVATTMQVYLQRTTSLRSDEQLFISFLKPYKSVSKSTIARWIKTVMGSAGIDTLKFKAHSTRAASVSQASQKDIPLDLILKTAGWSNAKTFARYYKRPISNSDEERTFASSIVV